MIKKDLSLATYEVGYGKAPEGTRFKKNHPHFPRRKPPESKALSAMIWEQLEKMQVVSNNGKREKRSLLALGLSSAAVAFAKGDPRPMERMLKLAPRLEDARPPRKTRKSLAQLKREYGDAQHEELYLILYDKAGVEPGKKLSPEDIQRAERGLRDDLIEQGVLLRKIDPASPRKADGADASNSSDTKSN